MSEFGVGRQVREDPVGAALRAATAAIIGLRSVDRRAARRLSASFDQIAHQHTSGLLDDTETIRALARLASDAGREQRV